MFSEYPGRKKGDLLLDKMETAKLTIFFQCQHIFFPKLMKTAVSTTTSSTRSTEKAVTLLYLERAAETEAPAEEYQLDLSGEALVTVARENPFAFQIDQRCTSNKLCLRNRKRPKCFADRLLDN